MLDTGDTNHTNQGTLPYLHYIKGNILTPSNSRTINSYPKASLLPPIHRRQQSSTSLPPKTWTMEEPIASSAKRKRNETKRMESTTMSKQNTLLFCSSQSASQKSQCSKPSVSLQGKEQRVLGWRSRVYTVDKVGRSSIQSTSAKVV